MYDNRAASERRPLQGSSYVGRRRCIKLGKLGQVVHDRRADYPPHRRDRQGGHRVPQRPSQRARRDVIPHPRTGHRKYGRSMVPLSSSRATPRRAPDAFLRRCVFYIEFPDEEMRSRGREKFRIPTDEEQAYARAVKKFYSTGGWPSEEAMDEELDCRLDQGTCHGQPTSKR